MYDEAARSQPGFDSLPDINQSQSKSVYFDQSQSQAGPSNIPAPSSRPSSGSQANPWGFRAGDYIPTNLRPPLLPRNQANPPLINNNPPPINNNPPPINNNPPPINNNPPPINNIPPPINNNPPPDQQQPAPGQQPAARP
jgi:hypothetical protein